MKKQFFRVKQLVDQTVSRAEKSEALTEDVQYAEKHIDQLKSSCSTTAKKIYGLMSGNEGISEEKRAKKMPETALGHSMMDSALALGEKSILKDLLTECGGIEIQLGHALMQHEIEVEKLVLQPLNQVENEANNIAKARRALNKLILDMDSAKARYQTAQKQANSGGNVTKIDGIKEEMEEALLKVDQTRDALAADIYTLLAKESDYAKLILQFAQSQRNYHKAALDVLDKCIPLLEDRWRDHVQKPVFGCNLEEHLAVTDRNIALPIEICVCALYETGMNEEGLFRIAGGASKVRKFRAALDSGSADLLFALELHDVHIVAGTLKSYLRELPEPIFSHDLYEDWVNSVRSGDIDSRLNALRDVISRLPETRSSNIRYLIKFFNELSRHQEYNKMTPQNLAIVLAPSLIWSPANGGDVFGLSALANTHASIIEHLISHADWFFPGEIDYYVTFSRITPATPSLSNFNNATSYLPVNGDRFDEHHHREEDRGHRRLGSYEGVVELRGSPSSGNNSENNSSKIESPRPTSRKKNKPAPIPPGQWTPGSASSMSRNAMVVRTPDKEEKKIVTGDGASGTAPEYRPHGVEKPSLPPTGPDTRRLSTLEKRPVVAPRPSLNPNIERTTSQSAHPQPPIGFETIESELKSRVAKQGKAEHATQTAHSVSAQKSDDEACGESTKRVSQPLNKKLSSGESTQQSPNPTHHPNAVPLFGFHVPVPTERTKLDSTDGKAKPSVPDRPSNVRIQVGASTATNASQDQSPSSERRGSYPPVLERIQTFSVNKQQVSIIQVNSNNAPLSLNSPDHPDIQFADSEDIPPTNASQTRSLQVHPSSVDADTSLSTSVDVSFSVCTPSAASTSVSGAAPGESVAKPERPPKPERLSHPSHYIESNNNKSESEEETATTIVVAPSAPTSSTASSSASSGTLPRPTPRPQPPVPPVKPRNASAGSSGSSGNVAESTDF